MLYISPCCWRRISPLSAAVTSLALNGVRRSPSGCGIQLVFGTSWGLYEVSNCIRYARLRGTYPLCGNGLLLRL